MDIQLQQMTDELRQRGHRQLCCLSGSAVWTAAQAQRFLHALPGDWLQLVPELPAPNMASADGVLPFGMATPALSFRAARTLLGREFTHALFDARQGLDAEALAIVAGALAAGSWLLLLVPDWLQWPTTPDCDSVRWSEQPRAIATPNFVRHCQQTLLQSPALLWREGSSGESAPVFEASTQLPFLKYLVAVSTPWSAPNGQPTADQQRLLQQLLHGEPGIYCLTADRGRGKSTLAGMLASRWGAEHPKATLWVTAPKRTACDQLLQRSGEQTEFIAPDALLARCQQAASTGAPLADWLIVDEAAALPTPQLRALLPYFRRCLLLTTVQGYEGTGRGFLLKFCAELQASGAPWHALSLSAPVRWAVGDPLEATIADLLLLDAEQQLAPASVHSLPTDCAPASPPVSGISVQPYQAAQLAAEPTLLQRFYGLLTGAHYRTSPLDLRRLLDAPQQQFWLAQTSDKQPEQLVPAAAWLVPEGGLSAELAQAIWRGERRPRGNLLVQSLAAHAGVAHACQLRSLRVSRIAVLPDWRRLGLASSLLETIWAAAVQQQQDFVSVSFGFTPALWAFWQRCGFHLVRIGTQKEASSGCYAAMAIRPCSSAGQQLLVQAQADFARRWPHQVTADWMDWPAEYALDEVSHSKETHARDIVSVDWSLDSADWRELQGFAYAHRSIEASWAALQRLLRLALPEQLPLLSRRLLQRQSVAHIVQECGLHGQKAWLQACRQEVVAYLQSRGISPLG
nr:GNAT family N-acetyltransferase [Plesiomonas shigelloides]